jgi:hypothetical protein
MSKLKICNLLRVTTYLELTIAIFILSWSICNAYLYEEMALNELFLCAFAIGSILQIIFSIAVVRMMHYYVPEQKTLDKLFLVFFQVSSVLTSIVSAASVLLCLYLLRESFWENGSWKMPHPAQLTLLSVFISYTVVSTYTIAGAAKLKKAILQNQQADAESWLEELENSVMA